MLTNTVFGFGSLINSQSVRTTAPEVLTIIPCYIKGFKRDFSMWDSGGFIDTNLDIAGVPYCALDVIKVTDPNTRVNGVVFKVNDEHLENLKKRERNYKIIETTAYDFVTDEPIGTCLLFSAHKNNGSYEFGSSAQKRYLTLCLEGAKDYGEQFYQEFLETTFIGDKSLAKFPELIT